MTSIVSATACAISAWLSVQPIVCLR